VSTDVQPPSEAADEEVAAQTAATAAPEVIADSFGEYAKIWWSRVRSGDSGALPVILGLAAIVIYFQARSSLFLSAGNLVNLIEQAAWIVMLGMAEVFVLLLGEIDLSIGYSSAIGAVFTAWLLVPPNPAPWPLAVLAGLAFPAFYGLVQGVIITWLRSRWPASWPGLAYCWKLSTWPRPGPAGPSGCSTTSCSTSRAAP